MCENILCNDVDCVVEYGFCHCGCDEDVPLIKESHPCRKEIKGNPRLYAKAWHSVKIKTPPYIIDEETGCWNWQGSKNRGYGKVTIDYKNLSAHRVYYEKYKGPIPEGLQIDHLCNNKGCVNPEHLEAVTAAENSRRSNATKITMEDSIMIKKLYSTGEYTLKKLGEMYNLTFQAISKITRGKSWVAK